jgi:hypothetical protein
MSKPIVDVVSYHKAVCSNFVFEKVTGPTVKGNMYNVLYNDKVKNMAIQLPKLYCPYGIRNVPQGQYNEKNEDKYSVSFGLDLSEKYNKNNEVNTLIEFLQEMDETIIDFLSKNSKEFWKKELTPKQIVEGDRYKSLIKKYVPKEGSDKVYPNTFKCKVSLYPDGKPAFSAIDPSKSRDVMHIATEVVDADGKPVLGADGKPTYKVNWDLFYNPFDSIAMFHRGSLIIVGNQAHFNWKLKMFQFFPIENQKQPALDLFLSDDVEEHVEEVEQDGVEVEED